jgi:polysaccharide biosynthesis/export protein
MRILYKLFILSAIFILQSCYTRYTNNLLQERKNLPQYDKVDVKKYRLKVNDELVIRVLSTNESITKIFSPSSMGQSAYRIFEDGTVDFPYMPRVDLCGKTIDEAEDILTARLKEFATDVEVKLALKTQTFCVIGEAGRGYFPIYKERLTIYQALALSGGLNDGARFNKVKIVRTTESGTIIKTFDIRTQSIIESDFYYIMPNDIIYVDMSNKKFWALNNFSDFVTIVTSSLTFLVTVISLK